MPHLPYEIWEHTADIGILAHGKNPEELFSNAAIGMFDIITGKAQSGGAGKRSKPKIEQNYDIDISARTLDQLMVDWLSELLYRFSAFRFLGVKYDIKVEREARSGAGAGWRLRGKIYGATYEREKHGYGADIKAVTYHMLEVREENGIWSARVLFDI